MKRRILQSLRLRAALAAFVAVSVSCSVPPPGRGNTRSEDIYRRNCVLCHGINGGGAQGPPLIDRPRSPHEVAAVLRSGRGEMPSFAEKLSPEEITAVAEYVSELSHGQ
ncbi:MAG: hypothetical protein C4318_09060 [Acidimicrobiia bacterium]